MHRYLMSHHIHRLALWVSQVMPIAIILLVYVPPVYGYTELGNRSITIGNDSPGVTTSYNVDFTITSGETLGSIDIEFCSNSPLVDESCTPVTGFNASLAQLNNQTGPGDFSISG